MSQQGIQATLFDYFKDTEYFTLQEANELVLEHQNRDVNTESIRARIYEGINKGLFERVGKGLYTVTRKDEQGRESSCLLINGDGRVLSFLDDNSVDAIITDHPYSLKKSLKGGNRDFADYELFQYNEQDFKEKQRVLKPGCFLVEFLPEENANNYEYLFKIKDMARQIGLEYYAKVPWKKGDFVANTGRKSKNTEDIVFFSKGRARELRPDAKKNKAEPDVEHFMSGAAGMLPTVFDVGIDKKEKIHQAEKPVELLQQILRFVTKEDELVLDQFAGSGSLGEAALKSHRDSILIEKDANSFNRLRERISALGEVNVYSENQQKAVDVVVGALEAHEDGPEAYDAYVDYRRDSDMSVKDACLKLYELPREQSDSVKSVLEYAKDITKHESYPKVLECSSRGDKRFSALYAQVTINGKEKSIEEWYQGSKRDADGKKVGKGKPFEYIVDPFTGSKLPVKDAPALYRGLWITYLKNNPDLVKYAEQFDEFSNVFAAEGLENRAEEIIGAYVKGNRDFYVDVVRASRWYKNMASHKKSLSEQILTAQKVVSCEKVSETGYNRETGQKTNNKGR